MSVPSPVTHWMGQKIGQTKMTEDIIQDLQLYITTIRHEWTLAIRKIAPLNVEKQFNLDWFMPGYELFGTNDASFGIPFDQLNIYDLKFGYMYVEVEENDQCLYYALGALGSCDYEKVKITIIQPRLPHPKGMVRSWLISCDDVMHWAEYVLKPAVLETEKSNARIEPGEHCFFCKAKQHGVCPEFNEFIVEDAKNDFEIVSADHRPKIEDLSNEQLIEIMQKLTLAVSFQKDCLRIAYERAMSGQKLPGYKLVNSISHRSWVSEKMVIERLKNANFDIRNFSKMTLFSPNQIQNALKDQQIDFDDLLDDLVLKPDKGLDLVPESDRRKAVESPALSDFENFK